MLDNAKISEDEVEVIAEAVAKRSWWKNPALYIPVITAVLSSPVVMTLLPGKVQPVEAQIVPQQQQQVTPQQFPQNVDRPRYNGQGQWQSRRPRNATVLIDSDLRKGPNSKKSPVIHLAEGARLIYSNCNQFPEVVEDMEGKWCEGLYKDDTGKTHKGWVFTAYLHTEREGS